IGEMLVRKEGHGFAGAREDFHDALHELVARVEFLATFVPGIVAVLSDKTNRIDGQIVPAQRYRILDGWIDGEPMFFGKTPAEIIGRNLVGVERHDTRARLGEDAVR